MNCFVIYADLVCVYIHKSIYMTTAINGNSDDEETQDVNGMGDEETELQTGNYIYINLY
jgi:hypothetical protein